MKFGISTFVTDEGVAPRALARAIEERGFDSLFVAEHTHIPLSRKSPWPRGGELPRRYYRTLDPFITLTAAAVTAEHLLLGTGVALVVERDPIITAKEVASLDLVSGGRVIFGVGVGWNREEMENHGTDPSTRGKLTDERILAMIGMWTKDKPEPMMGELREVAGRDVPVSVFNASSDLKDLEEYRRLGVERVLLGLPTLPESETLQQLDNLAEIVTDTR